MADIGKIHIYYGYGKGKTTAAVGQLIRAAGSGFQVLMFQFLKDNTSSERKILEMLPDVTCLPGCRNVKFFNQMDAEERAKVRQYNDKILAEIGRSCTAYDIVLLDEALCAVSLGLLSEEDLLSFLAQKPRQLEVILTGHEASERMIDAADYVTEMNKIKHPYDKGQTARAGIEY